LEDNADLLRLHLGMDSELTLSHFRDKGYKITSIRKKIVAVFSKAEKPLSAQEIYKTLHANGFKVNKTTVYRELQFLLNEDYLIEVYLKPSETSYELKALVHHHHLICEICGHIDSVTNCLATSLEEGVYKKMGFRIERHSLEFYGTCAKCAKRGNQQYKDK
jgi:Fe2+ or Zn2+ uptake regulation protein